MVLLFKNCLTICIPIKIGYLLTVTFSFACSNRSYLGIKFKKYLLPTKLQLYTGLSTCIHVYNMVYSIFLLFKGTLMYIVRVYHYCRHSM